MSEFIAMILQVVFLIMIAGACNLIAPKIKVPYTVLLFIVGLLLVPLSQLESFDFLATFSLSPDLLFYVFLPILLFESAYNMNYAEVSENKRSTWTLATVGLLLSTACIALLGYGLLWLLGIAIPFEVVLLFAVIIGTTDPVAVMALFKEYGAPKRLSFIFEGESCFNDGTGLALFLVVYEIIRSGVFSGGLVVEGVIQFILMIVGGIGLGRLFGIGFSHLIQYIKNNESVEILLTIVMAHLTFISADLIGHYIHIGSMELKISGVIATVFAGIIMGNYGRTKISPKVEIYMEKFRGFFGFISNSLVFILIGLIGATIQLPLNEIWLPVLVLILSVTVARAISIYVPIGILNRFKLEDYIPLSWQHLLAWGSLRGALAFMIALLIDDNFTLPGWSFSFTIKEFIMAAIIGKIAYTLLFKATTIPLLMKKLNIGGQNERDVFQKYESEILIFNKILQKVEDMRKGYDIPQKTLDELALKYQHYLTNSLDNMYKFLQSGDRSNTIRQSIGLQALGIEREYLDTMYRYGEVTESVYLTIVHKLDKQIHRLEKGMSQIKDYTEKHNDFDIIKRVNLFFSKSKKSDYEKYMKYRAQNITSYKVISYFKALQTIDLGYEKKYIQEIIDLYNGFINLGKKKSDIIYEQNKEAIDNINKNLYEKGLLKAEEGYVEELMEKNIISSQLYNEFIAIIDSHIIANISSLKAS